MYLPLPLLLLEGSGAAPQGSRSQQLACRWGWPDPLTTAAPQASSPLTSAAAPSCALAAAFSMLLSPFSHCSHTCPRASPPFTHTRYTPRSFVLLARPVAYIAGAPCPCSNLLLHFISAGSAQAPWWAHAPAPSCIGHLPPSALSLYAYHQPNRWPPAPFFPIQECRNREGGLPCDRDSQHSVS